MGFRAYKSFKVSKGVRVNVSKTGIGMSAGGKGVRYSAHSSGRTTRTVGIPGSGVRYESRTGGKGRTRSSAPQPVLPSSASQKPGLFAPKGERLLYKAVRAQDVEIIARVGAEFADYRIIANTIAGFMKAQGTDATTGQRLLEEVFAAGQDPALHLFAKRYLYTLIRIPIAPGIEAELPLARDAVGLYLAEIYQKAGDLPRAIDTVEQLDPSAYAAVSLAELYEQTDRHDDVIALTERITNEDDLTALLLVYRGIAFREQGMNDAALAAFKEALRSRSRAAAIRHLALSERARVHEATGRKAQARKDLERILAEDSSVEGIAERLGTLEANK